MSMKEEILNVINNPDLLDCECAQEIAVLAAVKCIEISMTVAGAVPNYYLLGQCTKEALVNSGFDLITVDKALELYNKNK